jgi:flotillin
MTEMIIGIMVILVAVVFTSFVLLLAKRYKRCPSNRVLVIYGKVRGGTSARTVHGGAAFVLPLLQDYDFLSLEPIQIAVPLKDALSIENIRVNVPSVFTVALGTQPEVMQNAAIRLLGLDTPEIKSQAEDIIFGQLRQVVASMSIQDINRDREKFLHNIQSSLEPELQKIGLVLINVNITDITDESGYIEAIGQKAASQAIQQARGDVAEQEKLGEVRVAEAERDKLVKVAEANKEQHIGTRSAERDQAVRVAEMAKEQVIGEQEAAFQRDTEVKNAERDMRVTMASANAQAIEGENTAKATVADSNAGLLVKQSDAYQLGETRKRESEAAVQEAQNRAMAKAAIAEAERIEAERRAQLEAPAKAQKAQTIVDAEAEAEKRRIEAEGQAKATFARLEAEAKGQYEILAKKGEGLKQIVAACGGSQEAFQMLMLEHLDHLADASAKAISNIKFDKVVVWENGGQNGSGNTAGFLHNLARTMPPMLQVMKDIGGVEIPEYLAKLSADTDGDTAKAADTPAAAPKAEAPKTGSPEAPKA